MQRTPPARKHEKGKDCSVCGHIQSCRCPWDKPFQHWPPVLLRTIVAMTHGGPHPGS
jgi:hypothetical protein